jgi:hypothetical protein
MDGKLGEFVKKNYPDSKSDWFAAFIERCGQMLKPSGYQAMITQHAWMFLSSYEKLRAKLLVRDIVNMAHLGARAFEEISGEVVQTTAFVLSNRNIADFAGTYVRLVDYPSQQAKQEAFLTGGDRHTAKKENFAKIPGSPVAYWLSVQLLDSFTCKKIREYGSAQEGIKTGDNNRFIRNWQEIDINRTNIFAIELNQKWQKTAKAGEHRRWYGSHYDVTNFFNYGEEILSTGHGSVTGRNNLYKAAVTWNRIATDNLAFRWIPDGFIPNMGGLCLYPFNADEVFFIVGFLNTKVARIQLNVMNPTMSFPPGTVNALSCKPSSNVNISTLAEQNIAISRADWDAFETSWDFKRHPLV